MENLPHEQSTQIIDTHIYKILKKSEYCIQITEVTAFKLDIRLIYLCIFI